MEEYELFCKNAEKESVEDYEKFLLQIMDDIETTEFEYLIYFILLQTVNPTRKFNRKMTKYDIHSQLYLPEGDYTQNSIDSNAREVVAKIEKQPVKILLVLTSCQFNKDWAAAVAKVLVETNIQRRVSLWTHLPTLFSEQIVMLYKAINFVYLYNCTQNFAKALENMILILVANEQISHYFMEKKICPACMNYKYCKPNVKFPILDGFNSCYNCWSPVRLMKYADTVDTYKWFNTVIALHSMKQHNQPPKENVASS